MSVSQDLSPTITAVTSGQSHTPGPWSFEALCFDRKIAITGGVTAYGRPYTIAHVNRPGSAYAGQDRANARLIAAAPELLEALQWVMSAHGEQLHDAFDAAHKAIAKATGLAPSSAEQVSGQVPGMNTEPQLSTGEQP